MKYSDSIDELLGTSKGKEFKHRLINERIYGKIVESRFWYQEIMEQGSR